LIDAHAPFTGQTLAQGIERAGADIAINDANGRQRDDSQGLLLMCRHNFLKLKSSVTLLKATMPVAGARLHHFLSFIKF
jgi:hypothetical protein